MELAEGVEGRDLCFPMSIWRLGCLRAIREVVNAALAQMSGDFAALYAPLGRPSIDPEKLLRASLLQAFYSVRSVRQLMERLEFDQLFRWFVGSASTITFGIIRCFRTTGTVSWKARSPLGSCPPC
jgi:Transposase domain (DUF772)